MKNATNNKPVAPIYAIAAVWLVLSLIRPIATLLRVIWAVFLSAVIFGIVRSVCGGKQKSAEKKAETAAEPAKPKAEEPKYSPEVQAVVDEGKKAHDELQRLYASIPELNVKRKVQELMDVTDKIVEDAKTDPSDVPQIKKFLDYYLPTTIKLLNAYDRMGAQGIRGENIDGTMQRIDEMLDTALAAYRKLLDGLFANQAMDIETDIDVMNTLLKREGLAENGEIRLKL